MLPSWRMMFSKKSAVSRRMEPRRLSSNSGKRWLSGRTTSILRSWSHWPAKFSTRASDFSSSSMRRTCASRTAGWRRRRSEARRMSSSSGMLLQRKYEARSHLDIAHRDLRLSRLEGPVLFDAINKRRRDHDPFERRGDAFFERIPLFAHKRVELQVRIGFPRLQRTAKGAPGEVGDNGAGTPFGVLRADEDAPQAFLGRAGGLIERAADVDRFEPVVDAGFDGVRLDRGA